MFVATLIAKPGALTSAAVEALRSTWDGAPNVWLSGGEAAEFEIPSIPSNRLDVWGGLQGQATNLVVQKVAGRKKRMLLADSAHRGYRSFVERWSGKSEQVT